MKTTGLNGQIGPASNQIPSLSSVLSGLRFTAIPFGKVPILEIDGVIIHQSLAIARYLAKENGVAGKTPLEQALVDAIVDTIDDFMSMLPWAEKDHDVKQRVFDDLLTNTAPGLLQDLEKFLGNKNWLVGESQQQDHGSSKLPQLTTTSRLAASVVARLQHCSPNTLSRIQKLFHSPWNRVGDGYQRSKRPKYCDMKLNNVTYDATKQCYREVLVSSCISATTWIPVSNRTFSVVLMPFL
ncbi:hematopoietic prostaglandin D synthase isoform X2 [Alligator mississippiensis]|uniref:hematopoietic prostaglandin D synthase isoform X2 n=1 Tax=Alligator mississippiensis TaxID=8496 RepID=UPI000907680C|nr:hematopoietic prostaglandin D synthase isoform X2 [Alligator mississippiensis]